MPLSVFLSLKRMEKTLSSATQNLLGKNLLVIMAIQLIHQNLMTLNNKLFRTHVFAVINILQVVSLAWIKLSWSQQRRSLELHHLAWGLVECCYCLVTFSSAVTAALKAEDFIHQQLHHSADSLRLIQMCGLDPRITRKA